MSIGNVDLTNLVGKKRSAHAFLVGPEMGSNEDAFPAFLCSCRLVTYRESVIPDTVSAVRAVRVRRVVRVRPCHLTQ